MSQLLNQSETVPDHGAILTKAVLRAGERLGLSAQALGQVIGVSGPTVTRMRNGSYVLDPASKPFELAALLIRLFRSLDAITGGEAHVITTWMRSPNTALGAAPAAAITTVTGLTRVIAYLDARRAVI